VLSQIIFENKTCPDEEDIKNTLKEGLDESLILLDVIRSSIVACEYNILFLYLSKQV